MLYDSWRIEPSRLRIIVDLRIALNMVHRQLSTIDYVPLDIAGANQLSVQGIMEFGTRSVLDRRPGPGRDRCDDLPANNYHP